MKKSSEMGAKEEMGGLIENGGWVTVLYQK